MQAPHAEVTRLIEAGEFEAARRVCQDVIATQPDAFAPHLWRVHVALAGGQPEEARDCLAAAGERGAPPASLLKLEFALARSIGDAARQSRILDELVALEPAEPRWWRNALALQLESRRDDDAMASLDRLLALRPDTPVGAHLETLAARTPASVFIPWLDRLVDRAPRHRDLRAARAQALARDGRMDAAWDDIEALLALDPHASFPATLRRAMLHNVRRDARHRQRFESLLSAHPRSGAVLWAHVQWLETNWEPQRARELVRANWEWARHTTAPPELAMWEHVDLATAAGLSDAASPAHYQALVFAGRLDDAIAFAPGRHGHALMRQAAALKDTRFAPMAPARDPGEVTVVGEERTAGTVLVFTGIQDQAWVPAHVLDRFFAELGLRAVYLRDYRRLAFVCGLESLGASLEDTLRRLDAMVDDPARPLYTMGASAGGLAAVLYAEALGARASVLFSPPSTFVPRMVERLGDARGSTWYRRLLKHVDPSGLDMLQILPRMPAGYRVTAYATAASVEDRAHVERIAAAPGVRVELLEGTAGHDSLAAAAARHDLLDVFRDAFGLPGVP